MKRRAAPSALESLLARLAAQRCTKCGLLGYETQTAFGFRRLCPACLAEKKEQFTSWQVRGWAAHPAAVDHSGVQLVDQLNPPPAPRALLKEASA